MEECHRYLGSFFVSLPRHRNARGVATDFQHTHELWYLPSSSYCSTLDHGELNERTI